MNVLRGILAAAVVLGAACGKEGGTPSGRHTIGLSVLTLNNPFFKEIADSLAKEAAKHGYEVLVVSGDFDPARQQSQVKDFLVKKVTAIVLCPCDSKAIGPSIGEAVAAGIPVFTADIACTDPTAKVVSHVATDNYQGGRLAADAIVEALGGKGKVAVLDHPVAESVQLRTKGFEDRLAELRKNGVSVPEVVAKLPGGGDKAKSFQVTQDLLQAHPELGGIFAINDPSALGARAALEAAGRPDAIKIVGFDGQPEARRAIREGKIYADCVQHPDQIGRETFTIILKYLKGEDVLKEVRIPTALYRKADADQDPSLR